LTSILIIGAGASGVLAAAHLLRHCPAASVVLIERAGAVAAGIAYRTDDPQHLLNVRAGGMSAWPDEPGHFAAWLEATQPDRTDGGPVGQSFVPRGLYRHYLQHVLETAAEGAAEDRLTVRTGDVVDLAETADGVRATLADGTVLNADMAVLATGNEPAGGHDIAGVFDGWSAVPALPAGASVLIIGTGLTMADQVASLIEAGHEGPMTAISADGRLPEPHEPAHVAAVAEEELPGERRLRVLTRWLRRRMGELSDQGVGWRGVIDGLRPHTQALWAGLNLADRRRFLRHGLPLWNVHRHRMPPAIAARVQEARAAGRLTIRRGRVLAVEAVPGGVRSLVALAGQAGAEHSLTHDVVIDCRGRSPNLRRSRNPLLQRLLASGLVRPDALGLGVEVTPELGVVSREGVASRRIRAIGPVTAGTFWEVTAVPDIRVQARLLAHEAGSRGA
jgi:uncharacterized NAD(P)/FAD-binding protein YdhS